MNAQSALVKFSRLGRYARAGGRFVDGALGVMQGKDYRMTSEVTGRADCRRIYSCIHEHIRITFADHSKW